MADELDPALGEPDPNAVPDEGELDPNVNDAVDQRDPIAELAMEMGWKPKDQFTGNENDWKPAADYIRAGRDIQQGLSKELRNVREEVSRISRTTGDLTERLINEKVAERDAHWQRVHRQAVEEGNVELADRAVEERSKLRAAPTAQPGEPPELASFKQRNSWYGSDHLATTRAEEIAERLAKRGVSIPDQLVEVERAIRKEFPEYAPAKTKEPPTVATGASRNAAPSSKAKGFNEMPEESKKVALDYEKRFGIKREETARSYWADQNRQRRA